MHAFTLQNNQWSVLHIAADMGLADILELLVQTTDEVTFNLRDEVRFLVVLGNELCMTIKFCGI